MANKKLLITFFFVIFNLIFIVNALDNQIYIPCGGDKELVIGCIGDYEYNYLGKPIETNQTIPIPISGNVSKSSIIYNNGWIWIILLIAILILILVKRRKNKKENKNE